MAIDPSVLEVLRRAVADDPDNLGLRLHLATTLDAAGDRAAAFAEAEQVLARRPDDLGALELAARVGAALGDPRAEAYARLRDALGGPTATPTDSVAPPPAAPPTAPPAAPQSFHGRDDQVTPDEPAAAAHPSGGIPGESAFYVPDSVDDLVEGWEGTEARSEPAFGNLERPRVTLADVAGLAEVKQRLELSFLAPMRNPELALRFGTSARGGLLLWGPPGCGKTYMARAIAGELGANFYEVSLSDVLDMWVGSSERNLHAVFDVARRNTPCVLFFDEIDAIGHKRSSLGGAAMRGVVNQLLAELDGVGLVNEGVFMLAATNHPWDVDAALIRPGRFDRKLLVLPPDQEARAAIFRSHLRDRPVDPLTPSQVQDLAKRTDGFSGADIALVCAEATEVALMESARTGSVTAITAKDLARAAKHVRPSIGPWLDSARNVAMFNNEGGDYDDLIAYLGRRR